MLLALWCMKMCAVKIANHILLFLILPDKHLKFSKRLALHDIFTVFIL